MTQAPSASTSSAQVARERQILESRRAFARAKDPQARTEAVEALRDAVVQTLIENPAWHRHTAASMAKYAADLIVEELHGKPADGTTLHRAQIAASIAASEIRRAGSLPGEQLVAFAVGTEPAPEAPTLHARGPGRKQFASAKRSPETAAHPAAATSPEPGASASPPAALAKDTAAAASAPVPPAAKPAEPSILEAAHDKAGKLLDTAVSFHQRQTDRMRREAFHEAAEYRLAGIEPPPDIARLAQEFSEAPSGRTASAPEEPSRSRTAEPAASAEAPALAAKEGKTSPIDAIVGEVSGWKDRIASFHEQRTREMETAAAKEAGEYRKAGIELPPDVAALAERARERAASKRESDFAANAPTTPAPGA